MQSEQSINWIWLPASSPFLVCHLSLFTFLLQQSNFLLTTSPESVLSLLKPTLYSNKKTFLKMHLDYMITSLSFLENFYGFLSSPAQHPNTGHRELIVIWRLGLSSTFSHYELQLYCMACGSQMCPFHPTCLNPCQSFCQDALECSSSFLTRLVDNVLCF